MDNGILSIYENKLLVSYQSLSNITSNFSYSLLIFEVVSNYFPEISSMKLNFINEAYNIIFLPLTKIKYINRKNHYILMYA